MARAAFSERHYELAVNIELVRESNEYFVPSQNEEAQLGYDIALVPALPKVWSSLTQGLAGIGRQGEPRIPRATSLFLQFKRPDFVSNRNGLEASAREQAFGVHGPYYRFELSQEQLKVLIDLQKKVAGRAAVCYAAGRFHQQGHFSSLKLASNVTANSTFLRLEDVQTQLAVGGFDPSNPSEDHFWTYDKQGGRGLLCSDPRPVDGFDLRSLKDSLKDRASGGEQLEKHVEDLRIGLGRWRAETVEPARDQLAARAEYELPDELYEPADVGETSPEIATQQTLDALGLGWFLAMPVRHRPS